ncbi:hypothetical protein [Neomicrococcus aestuarii]|nr:hypothetical protein [Neomicrococcus aestuarii]
MANGLRSEGLLNDDELRWLEEPNTAANAAYTDPSTVTPDCYDSVLNPGARSWFKSDASELLQMTAGYLQLLDCHGIQWMELRTRTPGRIVYEDTVQVVAVPYNYPEHWPFGGAGQTGA